MACSGMLGECWLGAVSAASEVPKSMHPRVGLFWCVHHFVLPISAHFGEQNIAHPSNRSAIHARQSDSLFHPPTGICNCIVFRNGTFERVPHCIAAQRPAHVRKSLSSTSRREFRSQFGICLSAPQSRVARTTTLPHCRTFLSACITSAHHAAAAALAAHTHRTSTCPFT